MHKELKAAGPSGLPPFFIAHGQEGASFVLKFI